MPTPLVNSTLFHSEIADAQPRKLLVLVHGWVHAAHSLNPLIGLLQKDPALKDYDFLLLSYHTGYRLIGADLDLLATDLNSAMTMQFGNGQRYTNVSLLGHSLGGLLVRHMYLLAKGATKLGSVGFAQPWADHVEALVLISTPNRGVSFLGSLGHYFLNLSQIQMLTAVVPGSEFITNLRLDWMDTMYKLGKDAPKVIQVLGTADKTIRREDSIDVVQFKNACHLFVPNETHSSIIAVRTADEDTYHYIRDAIIGGDLLQQAAAYSDEGRDNGEAVTQSASAVVFLVHGIRDYGAWLASVDKAISERDPQIHRIRSSYNYFSLIQFVLTPLRRKKLCWFRDEYTQARAQYPGVPIHYVGHSNGTYILANTLKRFRSIKVDRVYFAGSVLPRDFNWNELFERGQVQLLRNDCAAADWPVGVLCAGLSLVMPHELGIAGYQGFTYGDGRARQFRYIAGGHAAAIQGSEKHASIANFITGQKDLEPSLIARPTWWFEAASKAAPVLLILGLVLIVFLLWQTWLMILPFGVVGIIGAMGCLAVLMLVLYRL